MLDLFISYRHEDTAAAAYARRILPSPHHVFEIMSARTSRSSITGKLYSLGVRAQPSEEQLFELILDMFLVGPDGRPPSRKIQGNLEFYLERFKDDE